MERLIRILFIIILLVFIKNIYGGTHWTGYLTVTGEYSTVNQKHRGHVNGEGSFEDTRAALELAHMSGQNWSAHGELAVRGEMDFNLTVPQFYAQHQGKRMRLQVGRFRFPLGLLSPHLDRGWDLTTVRAADAFYNLHPYGPNIIQKDLTGLRTLWGADSALQLEAMFGHASLENGQLKQVIGLTPRVSRNGLHAYGHIHKGFADVEDSGGLLINDEEKTVYAAGLAWQVGGGKVEAEWAEAAFGASALDTRVYYVVLAKYLGPWQIYARLQNWDVQAGWGESAHALGVSRRIDGHAVLKLQWQTIEPDDRPRPDGIAMGLFDEEPDNIPVQLFMVSLAFKFQ